MLITPPGTEVHPRYQLVYYGAPYKHFPPHSLSETLG